MILGGGGDEQFTAILTYSAIMTLFFLAELRNRPAARCHGNSV
jgi:hypothetical protein